MPAASMRIESIVLWVRSPQPFCAMLPPTCVRCTRKNQPCPELPVDRQREAMEV